MSYRPTWAEINIDALVKNYHFVKQHVKPKDIIPVIKANAYGHGAVMIMKALIQEGVTLFAVSLLEEALELRAHDPHVELLMMGPILEQQFEYCHMHNIAFTVYDEAIAEAVLRFKKPLKCHLKIDTGMHRYGISDEAFVISWMEKMKDTEHDLVGIYSHFATANDRDELFYHQVNRMETFIHKLPYLPRVIHISNSSASLRYEKNISYTTHTRLGISLYGLSLDEDQTGLLPVMKLKTQIVTIKTVHRGETVGYGANYQATDEVEHIAILPIGYADGWLRRNKGGAVEINNKRYNLVGIICMDACFVKIDETVKVGDDVTLFGGLISTDEVAKRLETINYEVTCQVSYRVPRKMRKESQT
ncbi:MAG TPA: alanine racemase [Acholeplasmataceae bacterium]|nr:alanine racemase [Acholeplasmataceae bacterium]HRX45395.1 alanine racemase [Acholeplasmataceae bacterium]